MARQRRPARPDDFPTSSEHTEYVPSEDGEIHLLYNARGGIYRATEARAAEGGKAQPLGERIVTAGWTFLPGLNLIGEQTLARLSERPGFKGRMEAGELIDLGTLAEWPEIKPQRAVDYVKTTSDVRALKAIASVEDREIVGVALETQISEIESDRGTRQRGRALQSAHSQRRN